MQTEHSSIRQVASARLPTRWGRFRILGFETECESQQERQRETAVALTMGNLAHKPPLLRIHSRCLTGDAFSSLRCDCGEQLQISLSMIAKEGAGLIIYEEQEGRGIGLIPKIQAYELQDLGCDTVEANERLGYKSDCRDFMFPAQILQYLGIRKVRLITNNPKKIQALIDADIEVTQRIPCETVPTAHGLQYLRTKRDRMGHLLASI
ncbi:MAG: GTP cyclohydrolase II [Terracidiphilus sp.]|jgi:GTP cyclohydrolase II